MAFMDSRSTASAIALSERLALLEELVWSLAVTRGQGLEQARQLNVEPVLRTPGTEMDGFIRGGGSAFAGDAVPGQRTVLGDATPRRPLQTDGLGQWPAAGEPLPEGWEELAIDDQGQPQRLAWDPWNPEIPPSGKVITYDGEAGLFRIECGGVRYEVPWSDLEPKPPFSNPGPPGGLMVDLQFRWLEVRPRVVTKRFFFRQAHCKTQITCVVDYEIEVLIYAVGILDMERGVVIWGRPRRERPVRRETRRRTSDFTCPQQG
jgi:hypothetical protein